MLKKYLLLMLAALLLNACASAPRESTDPSQNPALALSGQWFFAEHLQDGSQRWSRNKPGAVARFQPMMNFMLPNTFQTTVLHPTDRHYSVLGNFRVRGDEVLTSYRLSEDPNVEQNPARQGMIVNMSFKILQFNGNEMTIRRSSQ